MWSRDKAPCTSPLRPRDFMMYIHIFSQDVHCCAEPPVFFASSQKQRQKHLNVRYMSEHQHPLNKKDAGASDQYKP
jgi:hypothetical protein